jgi:hypothetical protein
MKTLIVFIVSILFCGPGFGQNEYITLTSSDFIKGLNNKDFLIQKLADNGFIKATKTGIANTDIKTEKSPEDSKTIKNNTDTKTSKSLTDKKAGKNAALAALDESSRKKLDTSFSGHL